MFTAVVLICAMNVPSDSPMPQHEACYTVSKNSVFETEESCMSSLYDAYQNDMFHQTIKQVEFNASQMRCVSWELKTKPKQAKDKGTWN